MHTIKTQTAPKMFQNRFRKRTRKYPTNLSTFNYSVPPFKLSKSKYRITIRDPTLRKNILARKRKRS